MTVQQVDLHFQSAHASASRGRGFLFLGVSSKPPGLRFPPPRLGVSHALIRTRPHARMSFMVMRLLWTARHDA